MSAEWSVCLWVYENNKDRRRIELIRTRYDDYQKKIHKIKEINLENLVLWKSNKKWRNTWYHEEKQAENYLQEHEPMTG